jgi:hypothetical protein
MLGLFLPESGISLRLLVTELLLPSKDASFVAGFFSLGDHSLTLVGSRDSGPGEDVVGIQLEDAPRGFDGAVKIFPGVVGLRQAMERVGEFRIELERAVIFRDGFLDFSFAEEINSGVVVIFSSHNNKCCADASRCAAILPSPLRRGSRC